LACDVRNYEELKKALDKAVQENGPVMFLSMAPEWKEAGF